MKIETNGALTVASSEITKHFERMLDSGSFADVTFLCKGQTLPAHKAVLSSMP